MKWKVIAWVGSFTVIFLFLPSLAIKIWDYLVEAPWQAKSWLFYIMLALMVVFFVRWRWHKRSTVKSNGHQEGSLLFLAKERLVKGEISLEEFQAIKRELD
jgi:uncharacterized membrane protein